MGEVFAGRYELADPIGRGGVGAVWRAWDHRRRRYVAAKVLQQRDAHSLLRFVREQALRIDHPHVLAPASWAADDDKVLFTMDLVAGGSLVHLVGDYGPLPPAFVCTLLDQLLSGLAAVHAEGVVHRDIKPANVLLEATGTARPRLRLSDFGIAMRLGEPRLTETNLVVGTPGYLAPEQMLGADPAFPADLFAVGLVALYLLEGAKPDTKALVQYFTEHGTPGAPKGIPEPLWQVVAMLLQPDPEARFRTATGARKALAAAAELLPEPGPDDELIEIFDQLGPLPKGFAPDGPLKPLRRTAPSTRPGGAPPPRHPDAAPLSVPPGTPPHPDHPDHPDHLAMGPTPGAAGTTPVSGNAGTTPTPGHPGAHPGPGHPGTNPTPGHLGADPGPGHPGATPAPGHAGTTSAPGRLGTPPTPGHPGPTSTPRHAGTTPSPGPAGTTPAPSHAGTAAGFARPVPTPPSGHPAEGTPPARPTAPPAAAHPGAVAPAGHPAAGLPPVQPATPPGTAHPGGGSLPFRPDTPPGPVPAGTDSLPAQPATPPGAAGPGETSPQTPHPPHTPAAAPHPAAPGRTPPSAWAGHGAASSAAAGGGSPAGQSGAGAVPRTAGRLPEPHSAPSAPRFPAHPPTVTPTPTPTPTPSMSDTGSFHLPPPLPTVTATPTPTPTPQPYLSTAPHDPAYALPASPGRHGEAVTASYTAQDPVPAAPQRRGHRAVRRSRPGPPAKVAVPLLLLALACYAVGFWALARI
ncbi:protein kinase [Streptomyces sp. NPDC001381]|uniref:serine/threonine-protein kinase n=1 Tax=Streptomyces sp. NPDC001381 TaxID=3364567 RepID=UPI0036C1A69C